jgi:hypothetical protein
MIKIKPSIEEKLDCPICQKSLLTQKVLWQGIHVCIETHCNNCEKDFISDLPIGHGVHACFHVAKDSYELYGERSREWLVWLGVPFQKSLREPSPKIVELTIEKKRAVLGDVVILNCIDYLYGHSLLKLLNASRHINAKQNLVVIVPAFLKWCVPKNVSEIWSVNISLKDSQEFYPDLNKKIKREIKRFNTVYVSKALAHPKYFDVLDYTKVSRGNKLPEDKRRVLFVWREDRLWRNNENIPYRVARKLKIKAPFLWLQRNKIVKLFKQIRRSCKNVVFVVAGLGKTIDFPEWISDLRVEKFDETNERELCKIYGQTDVIIGIHGSNMLLPSGHANMVLDLMPKYKWGNFAQDILYQEDDCRMASYRYKYIPIETSINTIARIVDSMLVRFKTYQQVMLKDCQ